MTKPLSVNDLCVVLEELYEAQTCWYNFGLKLGLKPCALDAIKTRCSGDECFQETLKEYLKTTTPSWRALVEALRSPIVNQPQLAEKVEQKYCPVLKLPSKLINTLYIESEFQFSRQCIHASSPIAYIDQCWTCNAEKLPPKTLLIFFICRD